MLLRQGVLLFRGPRPDTRTSGTGQRLTLSKPNKDFGRAFYLSDDRQQALEMVQFRAEFDKKNSHQSSKEPQWNKDTMKE